MKPSLEEKEVKEQGTDAYVAEGEDKIAQDFFSTRLVELRNARQNVLGKNIEDIWRAADIAYIPHQATDKGKNVGSIDDELGWAGQQVKADQTEDWQENSVPPNPYIKIQTALGILLDRNPEGVFNPGAPKYERNTLLMENLYKRSWDIARSKQQLKLFIFNQSKYGWAVGRTYPMVVKRKVRDIEKFDPMNPKNNKYKDQDVIYFDDIFREALNPWTVWVDDGARPNNIFSVNDWAYYKDYSLKAFLEQFGHLKNAHLVKLSKQPMDDEDNSPILQKDNVIRVWFYENLERDSFYIETDVANGNVVLVNEPIPFSPRNKKLSLWQAPWTLRDDRTIFGIGIYEAMRNDAKGLTKIRGMTMDQLVLSIRKMGFHSGTNNIEGNGDIEIRPGVMKQMIDPTKITWMDVPGPGKDSAQMISYLENKLDEATGITKTIEGEIAGKTAFEAAQSKEFALKRLRIPLGNIIDALTQEAYITVALIEDIYSVPKVERLGNKGLIQDYRDEILKNPELFEVRDKDLFIKEYRQVQLGLDQNEDGVFEQADEVKFFTLTPDLLKWEGVININPQSVLLESEILNKQLTLELVQAVTPMLEGDPLIFFKPVKQILKKYKEDSKEWMPDFWLTGEPDPRLAAAGGLPGGAPQGGAQGGAEQEQFIVNQ